MGKMSWVVTSGMRCKVLSVFEHFFYVLCNLYDILFTFFCSAYTGSRDQPHVFGQTNGIHWKAIGIIASLPFLFGLV